MSVITPARRRELMAISLPEHADESWREQAACRGMDPRLFYPERGENSVAARSACADCPARLPCLAAVIAECPAHEDYGIRGDTTATERRVIRQQMPRHGTRKEEAA